MSPVQLVRDTRREGFKRAWNSFRRRRHLLPVLAYIFLACMTAYTFNAERHHSNENRDLLAQEVHATLVNGCDRGNELRATLQTIISNSAALQEPQIKKALKDGQITQAQADLARQFTEKTLKDLGPINCKEAYPAPTETE